eukprot:TRINITY_DN26137_c0_g2_i1.p2 TRINITY_DN26137_c0_g2~~TRINITY_DN26137_c0_g2_i1.p2  ORF type:complete len:159 (+),score=29.57 TRINITY_DN26137_c0_g2_i1:62-478(+)
MVAGCVPVLLFHPDTYPVLPFVSRLPWSTFTIMEPVLSEEDAVAILKRLLATTEEERERLRRQLIVYAPLVALELYGCARGAPSALSLVSAELADRWRLLKTTLLPSIATAPPPADKAHWLRWGPAADAAAEANVTTQ